MNTGLEMLVCELSETLFIFQLFCLLQILYNQTGYWEMLATFSIIPLKYDNTL